MALFNSRKRHGSSQPASVGTSSPAPEPITAQRVQVSPAPLGAGLRLVSVAAPEATATPAPEALPAREEARADDLRGLPLGTILYRRGLVEQSELEEALAAGMESGERLGEVLIRRGLVAEEEIGRCLAAQQGLPFLDGEDLTVDPEVVSVAVRSRGARARCDPRVDQGRFPPGRPARAVAAAARAAGGCARPRGDRSRRQSGRVRLALRARRERSRRGSGPGRSQRAGTSARRRVDAGWFGAEAAPEDLAHRRRGCTCRGRAPGIGRRCWRDAPARAQEEQQMEQSWNAESAETSEPTAWLESSDGAESGVTDPGAGRSLRRSSRPGTATTARPTSRPVADDPTPRR